MKCRFISLLSASLLFLGFSHGWCFEGAARVVRDPRERPEDRRPTSWPELPAATREHSNRISRGLRTTVPQDDRWSDGFGLPVTDGDISAAIEFQGSFVIAGRFTRIGDVAVNNIARWDGVAWQPLGKGIEGGTVSTLAIHQGDLVAGGDYWYAGGTVCRSIARWNGAEWLPFGRGLEDAYTNPREVRAMGSHGDMLVVAVDVWSEYYYSDPTPAPSPWLIYSWAGTEWVPLSAGANGPIWAFGFLNDGLFAGGAFDSIGAVPVRTMARWDGSTWSEVGEGFGTYGLIGTMTSLDGKLVVGGGFDSVGGIAASNIAAWDGSQWSAVGSLPNQVATLGVKGGQLIAGYQNALMQWDGQSWSSATPSIQGTPVAIADVGGELFVAGAIEATNPGEPSPAALSFARLAGDQWHSLESVTDRMDGVAGPGGQGAYVSAVARYGGGIVVAGSFRYLGDPPGWAASSGIAEWTGTQWSTFPQPSGLDLIYSFEAQQDTLYAAGTFNYQEGTPSSVFRYDGASWAPLGSDRFIVMAMSLYRGSLCVAAREYTDGSVSVRRWTGSAWEIIGSAESSYFPTVFGLVEWNGKLVAAGRFAAIGGVAAANIAAWDGVTWEQVGPGLPSNPPTAIVRNLAVSRGSLLATGDHLGGVMQWSRGSWQPFGELRGNVYSLVSVGNTLLVSGYLHNSDFSHEFSLARWNGFDWEEMGSGTNGIVSTAAVLGNDLYVGGGFSEAGGKASYSFARWVESAVPPAAPTVRSAKPNPFVGSTTFNYSLPLSGHVRLSIHDARGREIAVIEEGQRDAGEHTVIWNGHDSSGRKVVSGVYFLRAGLPGGVQRSKKVVLLR